MSPKPWIKKEHLCAESLLKINRAFALLPLEFDLPFIEELHPKFAFINYKKRGDGDIEESVGTVIKFGYSRLLGHGSQAGDNVGQIIVKDDCVLKMSGRFIDFTTGREVIIDELKPFSQNSMEKMEIITNAIINLVEISITELMK